MVFRESPRFAPWLVFSLSFICFCYCAACLTYSLGVAAGYFFFFLLRLFFLCVSDILASAATWLLLFALVLFSAASDVRRGF
jgi:hypothetical protein